MYYKSRKLQSIRRRITDQLKAMGWQERICYLSMLEAKEFYA